MKIQHFYYTVECLRSQGFFEIEEDFDRRKQNCMSMVKKYIIEEKARKPGRKAEEKRGMFGKKMENRVKNGKKVKRTKSCKKGVDS